MDPDKLFQPEYTVSSTYSTLFPRTIVNRGEGEEDEWISCWKVEHLL